MITRRTLLAVTLALVGAAVLAGSAQAATPAWRLLAVTGPTHLPPKQNEVQKLIVEAEGGSFTLTATTGKGTGTLSAAEGFGNVTEGSTEVTGVFPVSGSFVPGQAISGPAIPEGTTVTAVGAETLTLSNPATTSGFFSFLSAGSNEVTDFATASGTFRVGDGIAGAGIPAGTTVTAVGAGTLTLSAVATQAGPSALTATETTAPIAHDSAAPGLGSALAALPGFGPGSVAVVGGPGDRRGTSPYFLTFTGPFAEAGVAPLSADRGALTGPNPNAQVATVVEGGPGTGEIAVFPSNVGGAASAGIVTLSLGPLPPGITISGPAESEDQIWSCPDATGQSSITCTSREVAPALSDKPVSLGVPVSVETPSASSATVTVSISGGGAGPATYQAPIVVSAEPAPPGVHAFFAGAFDANGNPATQAGGHPFSAITAFRLNTVRSPRGMIIPSGDVRDVDVDLPPGFLGNPLVTPRCPQRIPGPNGVGNAEGSYDTPLCNVAMKLGRLSANVSGFRGSGISNDVYNTVPAEGYAAEFTSVVFVPNQSFLGSLRSDQDFGVTINAPTIVTLQKVYGSFVALEGIPPAAGGKAFLTNSTNCSEQARSAPLVSLQANTYQQSSVFSRVSESQPSVTGCELLRFEPGFRMAPNSAEAAAPTGATAELSVDQQGLLDPAKLAPPHLKRSVVTLPEGLTLNPSAANGLKACSTEQIGLKGTDFAAPNPIRFNLSPPACPDASKVGTVEIESPLLEAKLNGTIYLAAQGDNPFNSLLALYLVVDDARTGIVLKLPGEVRPDPATGQLTAFFDNNPQLPFTNLKLNFRGGGPQSTLATPDVCGTYTVRGEFTPWSAPESGPPAQTENSFAVTGGPGGAPCASSKAGRPFAPSFQAGSSSLAGSYSPLEIRVSRRDGEQELRRLEFTLPPGLTGKLAGIPYCPEAAIAAADGRSGKAEQASPSCPRASEVGRVDTAAGFGPEPIHVGGRVYLAGPYRGAPISTVVVTPAVAGPFDLGNVVVRAPIYVDPTTAQLTAKSDPIPTILEGIPVQVRSVSIEVDRPGFTLNPTNCEPMSVTTSIVGGSGAVAAPSNRFQVDGCRKLAFKPRLALRVSGKTNRNAKPRFRAVLRAKPGEANIARAQVNLPHSEFLEQNHIKTICTRVQFNAGAGSGSQCPKGSIYGQARAYTPLLDKPLTGPVYLRSSSNKLPDLVAALNGQVNIELAGKVDSGQNEGIRNTFEVVPDAPVSKFILEMKGGKKGLLVNSENLCSKKAKTRAIVRFTGQNGAVHAFKPKVANSCGKKGKSKKGKRGKHGRGHQAR